MQNTPTKKYLCIQRNDPSQLPPQPPSPDEIQKIYTAFNAWMEKYKTNLTDLGGRLEPTGRKVTPTGVTDGPFPESKEVIDGFMILTADNYETAVQIAQEFPASNRCHPRVPVRSPPRVSRTRLEVTTSFPRSSYPKPNGGFIR